MITNNFNTSENFWKVNPALMITEPFRQLIKDLGSNESSKIMWFVSLLCDDDPTNPYRNLPEDLKIKTIIESKLITEDFYKKRTTLIQELKERYYLLIETPAKRQLRIWNIKMDEKSEFMLATKYDAGTFEVLEKMMASNAKIFTDYENIMKKIATEDPTLTRGGSQESLTDSGQI